MQSLRFLKKTTKSSSIISPWTKYFREMLAYTLKDLATELDRNGLDYENHNIHLQDYCQHIGLQSVNSLIPQIDTGSKVSHTAHLLGRVEVGKNSRIEPMTSLKANESRIEIGDNCYIGKFSTLHVRTDMNIIVPQSVCIGNGSIVGEKSHLSTCTIGENVWIGDNWSMSILIKLQN